jgi:3-hexulose-6-phosphate synthase
MLKLQLEMDTLDGEEALRLAECTGAIEAGTPLIKSVGIGIVSKSRTMHPKKIILADLKSSDVGAYEADMAFRAGADNLIMGTALFRSIDMAGTVRSIRESFAESRRR